MIPRDVFVVGVRIVGLLQLAKALDYLISAFDLSVGFFKPYSTTIGSYYAHILVYLVVGLYLLSGAPDLVRKLYRPSEVPKTEGSVTGDGEPEI
jgi:hypothetical protein